MFLLSLVLSITAGVAQQLADDQSRLLSFPLIPHHARNGAQRRKLRTNMDPFDTEADALYQGYGTHYVDLWVGCPPQRQTVIVDTGSSVTGFPCHGCSDNCGEGYHVDSVFDELKSSCFSQVSCGSCRLGTCDDSNQCVVRVSYAEGSSWSAFEAIDLVYSGGSHEHVLDNKSAFELRFACQTRLTGLFQTQLADGIMGMRINDKSYWKQMYDQDVIDTQQFSLCFSRQPVAEREGTNAGAMVFGGTDARLHQTTMLYTNLHNNNGKFGVELQKMYLRTGGGESVYVAHNNSDVHYSPLPVNHNILNEDGEIFLDSGSTDTHLAERLFHPFQQLWKKVVGTDFVNTHSFQLTDDELAALPTIILQMSVWEGDTVDENEPGRAGGLDHLNPSDILVAFPPSHYLEYDPTRDTYHTRLYFTKHKQGVLGANFMMGHDIHFDVENNRIGFAESICDYSSIPNEESTE